MIKVSSAIRSQSLDVLIETIQEIGAKYGIEGEIISPVNSVSTPWVPYPFPAYFITGLVRIGTWFGTRTIQAAEFFPSLTNDVDARMKQYQAEQIPPRTKK